MSSSTDNVRPSSKPSIWRIGNVTVDGVIMGIFYLGFCVSCLAVGKFGLGLGSGTLLTVVDLTLFRLLAANGILMKPLPVATILNLFVAAIGFAFLLDAVKLLAFRRFAVT